VSAWSSLDFAGTLESITITRQGIVWAVFNREVDGVIGTYIEVQQDGLFLDSAINRPSNAIGDILGLTHLAGEDVKVIKEDGVFIGNFTVDSNGDLALGEEFKILDVTIGLPYEFKVKTLPVALQGTQGSMKFDRKRITRAFVEVLETIGVNIVYNSKTRNMKGRTANLLLGSTPPIINGVQEVFLNGYSRTTQVELIQNEPYAATVLSLGLELEV
jgi:hypothetical protein